MYFCITMGHLGGFTMSTLTVTTRGQVTFRKKVMEHLGVKPGGKIELDLLPDGRGLIRAARPAGKIDTFIGMLAGKTKKVATIEEMNEAAAAGWAGEVSFDESGPDRSSTGKK